MNRRKAVLITVVSLFAIGALALLALQSLTAFRSRYSMGVVSSYEIGAADARQRVLIATQGSMFKYAVVEGLIQQLKQRSIHIKVIDVSELPRVREDDWSAIVIVHTWENWRPQRDAKAFLDRSRQSDKIVVVTTSGSGREKIPGTDVISAASELRDVPAVLAQVTTRLDAVLDRLDEPVSPAHARTQ